MARKVEPQNAVCAARLREMADVLAAQGDDGFRIAAYRRAADVIDTLRTPVASILAQEGREGLVALPAIGTGIAAALAELTTTGHWSQLERLRGTLEPETLFQTLPGIGPELARKIIDALDIESLEALETAAHDGSLERVKGIGPRRAQMLRATLAERLGRKQRPAPSTQEARPPVAMLLDVDREYRNRAGAGALPTIAPRRFNPTGEAWLPVLHTRRGPWSFTVLFSNTERAHRLGRAHDWVIVYYQTAPSAEGQCTIVTESRGALAGQRVVRGREAECASLVEPAGPA